MSTLLHLGQHCTAKRVNQNLASIAHALEGMRAEGFTVAVGLCGKDGREIDITHLNGFFLNAHLNLHQGERTSLTVRASVQYTRGGQVVRRTVVNDFIYTLSVARECARIHAAKTEVAWAESTARIQAALGA